MIGKIFSKILEMVGFAFFASVLLLLELASSVVDVFLRKGLTKGEKRFNDNLDKVILHVSKLKFGGTYSFYRSEIDSKMEELGMTERERLDMTRRIRFMEGKYDYEGNYRMQDFQDQLIKRLEWTRKRPPENPIDRIIFQ